MKLSKDQILKQKFWVMLTLAVPLILAGHFVLLVLVAGEIDGDRKKIAGEVDKGRKVKGPFFSEKNVDAVNKYREEVEKMEGKAWGELYSRQADLMFWPEAMEKTYPIHKGKFLRELKYLDGGAVAADKSHHISGTVVDKNNISITLQTKNGKEQFFGMAPEDMKLDNAKQPFDVALKEAQVGYQVGWYFPDRLTSRQLSEYRDSYHSQIRPILAIVDPVNEDGEGVVTLNGWQVPTDNKKALPQGGPTGVRFLRFVADTWNVDGADISEEIWYAQEELWIQKEIYRLIRQANDYVGKMDLVGKPAVGQNQPATFKNPYFELTLKLVGDNKVEVKITNLQSQRQKLDMFLKVSFDQNVPDERFRISEDPLDPRPSDPKAVPNPGPHQMTKVYDLPAGPKRTGVYAAEQVLTWETAAVRRIDSIAIGMLAPEISINHRSYPDGVKPLVPEKKDPAAAAPVDAIPAPVAPVRPGRGGPGFGGLFAPQGDLALMPNGISKKRYSEEPNDQTRRLPVAISLIVYQNHLDRVLTSFSNSKMRFVMNQLLINRYPMSVRPAALNQDPNNPGFPLNPAQPAPLMPRRPAFGPGPGFGPRGVAQPPFNLQPGGAAGIPGIPGSSSGDDEMEANVELVMYGTVTLYQRFPHRQLPKSEPEVKQ
jgi:hypothetical protein